MRKQVWPEDKAHNHSRVETVLLLGAMTKQRKNKDRKLLNAEMGVERQNGIASRQCSSGKTLGKNYRSARASERVREREKKLRILKNINLF